MKTCRLCKKIKEFKYFAKKSSCKKDGHTGRCKDCLNKTAKEKLKKIKNENPEEYQKFRSRSNQSNKKYKDNNREEIREKNRVYSKKRYWTDPEKFRAKERLPENVERKRKWAAENRERLNAKVRERYQNDPEFRERYKAYQAKWYKENIDYVRQKQREYKKKNYERIKEQHYKYWAKYPEKKKAVQMVNNRIEKGTMKKPERCELCNKKCKVEGHHEDYSKPLDVIWLCKSCHTKIHRGTYLGEE